MSTNPPVPPGYKLLSQVAVTPAMTDWALKILRNPGTYPMFSTATLTFDGLPLLARVEWHPPDFQNPAEHRGVTLYEPVKITPDGATAEGIDVSGYQPRVDWPGVAASGAAFAFIKATESTTLVDHSFADHWAEAKRARILRGAYHFFRPQQDARAQAQHFLAQLGDRGELPPALDVEVADGVAPSKIIEGVHTWLDLVGVSLRPLLYTSPGFWNSLPGAAEISKKADLWVAHWGARAPAPVNGWSTWKFWQFTSKGTIVGIPGSADKDEDRFNGSLGELQSYSAAHLNALPRPALATFNLKTTLGVQQALNVLHIIDPPLAEDGVVGPMTWAAVETFQKNAGLRIDGIAGPNTIAALQHALHLV
jgi:GH25 family lysozyme M1 (1,4-beta-N-acetylmuramidase)